MPKIFNRNIDFNKVSSKDQIANEKMKHPVFTMFVFAVQSFEWKLYYFVILEGVSP